MRQKKRRLSGHRERKPVRVGLRRPPKTSVRPAAAERKRNLGGESGGGRGGAALRG